jgi:hypothetical protein
MTEDNRTFREIAAEIQDPEVRQVAEDFDRAHKDVLVELEATNICCSIIDQHLTPDLREKIVADIQAATDSNPEVMAKLKERAEWWAKGAQAP